MRKLSQREQMAYAAIAKLESERDQLKAENAGLKTGYEAYERENAELGKDAERYRWLQRQCSKGWKEVAELPMNTTDDFIDAAKSKEAGR